MSWRLWHHQFLVVVADRSLLLRRHPTSPFNVFWFDTLSHILGSDLPIHPVYVYGLYGSTYLRPSSDNIRRQKQEIKRYLLFIIILFNLDCDRSRTSPPSLQSKGSNSAMTCVVCFGFWVLFCRAVAGRDESSERRR